MRYNTASGPITDRDTGHINFRRVRSIFDTRHFFATGVLAPQPQICISPGCKMR